MTVRHWDYGAATGAWTTAANWSGDTVPIAADEVIFDGRVSTGPSTNMAVGDTGGIDFDLIHVKKSCTFGIGAAGSPLHTSAQRIIIEGSGTYYIEVSEDATGKDQVIPLVIVNNKDATVYLSSNENDASWCCEFTTVIVIAGTVYIGHNGSAEVDTAAQYLRISPLNNNASNVTVKVYPDCERYKATVYKMSVYMNNGTLTTDSAANEIVLRKGTIHYGTDGAAETGMDITTLRIHDGLFNWYPDDSGDDAYIGDLWLHGGTLDASDTINNDRSKVLGNGAGNDIHIFEGATLNVANNMGNITIAASSQLWNFGGTVITDRGSELAVSYDQP